MTQDLTAEIIEPGALTEADIALWRSIVEADPAFASPFFSPDFTQAVAGVAPDTAVAVLRRQGEVVGFFPFQHRGDSIQPIGAPLNDYHGVIAAPGDRPTLTQLRAMIGLSSLAVTGWIGETGDIPGVEHESLVADLSTGWADYDAAQRATWRKFFSDKDRVRRGLVRDRGEIGLRFETAPSASLDRLIALKRSQYQRSGRHDIFACGWTEDLLRLLLESRDPAFGGVLAVLTAGDEPIAYEYSLYAGGHYHFWFPAYELAYARYSPGILLSLDTMREMSGAGYRTFDFAHAGEPYKKYFCNRAGRLFEGAVGRDDIKGALRSAALATPLGQSIHRRWKTIDGCETSSVGRLVGLAVAARAMAASISLPGLREGRGPSSSGDE